MGNSPTCDSGGVISRIPGIAHEAFQNAFWCCVEFDDNEGVDAIAESGIQTQGQDLGSELEVALEEHGHSFSSLVELGYGLGQFSNATASTLQNVAFGIIEAVAQRASCFDQPM